MVSTFASRRKKRNDRKKRKVAGPGLIILSGDIYVEYHAIIYIEISGLVREKSLVTTPITSHLKLRLNRITASSFLSS